uniref:Uncharacterized protein n=1 Tax=Oryza nivara TaxID=4536 RepID=A0A0E0IG62_ORYNI
MARNVPALPPTAVVTGEITGVDIIGGRPESWLALAQSVAARGSWPKSASSDSQEVIEAGVEHPSKSSHRRRSSASVSSVKPKGGGFGSDDNGDKEVQGRRGGELDGGKKQGHGSGAARHSALVRLILSSVARCSGAKRDLTGDGRRGGARAQWGDAFGCAPAVVGKRDAELRRV